MRANRKVIAVVVLVLFYRISLAYTNRVFEDPREQQVTRDSLQLQALSRWIHALCFFLSRGAVAVQRNLYCARHRLHI
jgi:hypothetical protein